LDESANFQPAADRVRGYRADLAARIFRSPSSFRGKLWPKMELCSRQSSPSRACSKREWMVICGRNWRAPAV